MSTVVADTSGLVSLGTVAKEPNPPLDVLTDLYTVHVPTLVVTELEDTAAYEDVHGTAARAVLSRLDTLTITDTSLDASFPLDDGENAAVTLANELQAAMLLCDEFSQLPFIHASLTDTRLVTTPTFLRVLHRRGVYTASEAEALLDGISEARSWGTNSYVRRVRETFSDE